MYLNDCDYFIDDAIHNCEEAKEKSNAEVLMMKTNKTKDYTNDEITIVNDWEEIFNYIISRQKRS